MVDKGFKRIDASNASLNVNLLMYQLILGDDPQLRIGYDDDNEGHIQAVYDVGFLTLDYLLISTDSDTEGDIALMPAGNVGIGTTDATIDVDINFNFNTPYFY